MLARLAPPSMKIPPILTFPHQGGRDRQWEVPLVSSPLI